MSCRPETRRGKMIIPKVSVIIPTHNRAKMLRRAIESVLTQTWRGEFEVIVVSDGSRDNTEDVVTSFRDQRIRFLRHETSRGPSAARNTGLRAARGKYIAFLDDDDEWTPNKLEVQLPLIENSSPEVGLVYAWMEYFRCGRSRSLCAPTRRGDVFVEMLDNQAIGGCPTIMIKREVVDEVGHFDESLPRGNDGDYWRRIAKRYKVEYIPEILAKVHAGHKDRISCANRHGIKAEIFALCRRLSTYKGDFGRHPEKEASVLARIAADFFLIGKLLSGIRFLWKASQSRCSLATKLGCLSASGKLALRRLVWR